MQVFDLELENGACEMMIAARQVDLDQLVTVNV